MLSKALLHENSARYLELKEKRLFRVLCSPRAPGKGGGGGTVHPVSVYLELKKEVLVLVLLKAALLIQQCHGRGGDRVTPSLPGV